jgi:hypothetical protein
MDKDQHTQSLWVKYMSAFIALELLEKIKKNKRTFGKLSQLVVSEFQFVASSPAVTVTPLFPWLHCTIDQQCPADDIGKKIILMPHTPTLRLSWYINRKNTRDKKGLFKK